MNIAILLKIAGIGALTSMLKIMLEAEGKNNISGTLLVIAGTVICASLVLGELNTFIKTTIDVFNLR